MAGRRGTNQQARARQRMNRGRGARVNANTVGGRKRGGATSPNVDRSAVNRSVPRQPAQPSPAQPSPVQGALRDQMNKASGRPTISSGVTRMGRVGMAAGAVGIGGAMFASRRRSGTGHNQSLYR